MPQDCFQRLAVFFIDAKQKKGQHQTDHKERRRFVANAAACKDVGGDAHQSARAKAYNLAFRQVERHFCFYFGKVFGYGYKGHKCSPP